MSITLSRLLLKLKLKMGSYELVSQITAVHRHMLYVAIEIAFKVASHAVSCY